MSGRSRKTRPAADGDWTAWSAEPSRLDLRIARRWGVITNTKVSNQQFNVYRSEPGFFVTMQTRDGTEVGRDGTGSFKGGQKASIAEAWEAMAMYVSDMLNASGMMELPCQKMIVVDTTPDHQASHLATFEYRDGSVHETRNFDPETRESLACPVASAQIGELEASRHRSAELLPSLLDAAVYRMSSCTLAAEVLSEFQHERENFDGAKDRYFIFVSWCARRAAMAACGAHRDEEMIIGIMDALIQEQFEQLFGADNNAFDFAADAFCRFDSALANDTEPGPGWWIGKAAASFIFGANFEGVVSDPENMEKWAKRFALPSQVLLEINADATRILRELR